MTKRMQMMGALAVAALMLSTPAYAGEAQGWQEQERRDYERREAPPPPAAAVQEEVEEWRPNDIQLSGGFFHALGTDRSLYNLDFTYGRFLTEMFQVGVRQGFSLVEIDDAEDAWVLTTTGLGLVHLRFDPEQRVVPIVGGFLGAAYNDDDISFTAGPTGALRIYMSPATYIQGTYRYEWYEDDIDFGDDDESSFNHVVTLGIGYRF